MTSLLLDHTLQESDVEESDFWSLQRSDCQMLEEYLSSEASEKGVAFASEIERHEAHGNEKLACCLLAAAVERGIGFEEAQEVLWRLEQRQYLELLYAQVSFLLGSSSHACYDCHADPELQSNIDLLKTALSSQ